MAQEALGLLPEIVLLAGALAALLGGSFLPRPRQWVARLVAAATLLACAGLGLAALRDAPRTVFEGTYALDTATAGARLVVPLATLLVIGLGVDELAGTSRESETYALLLFSALGAVLLAGANDLLVLAVAFLLASIPLYALIGLAGTPVAAEAALKTYLLGALFGIVMLAGVTLLRAITGDTTYAVLADHLATAPAGLVAVGGLAVLTGLLFKAGAVPAHFWVPDAATGASTTAAAFATTVPKVGALVAVLRLVDALPGTVAWPLLLGVLAVASMTLGNLAAFAQTDPRRLLGWSTVSQVGYLLAPVAVAGRTDLAAPALLLYLAAYSVTNLTAFAVIAALPSQRDLAAYRGLASARPWLAGALLLALLGLLGTPPTSVFAGKLTVAAAAWDGGLAWLAVAVLANTVASLYYYLRWFAPSYRPSQPHDGAGEGAFAAQPWAAGAAVTAAFASLALGLLAGVAWSVFTGPLTR